MYLDILKNKIFEQAEVYDKVKNGERSSVVWKAFHDTEWGIRDFNYLNRNRLAHYISYARIDDEETIKFLFVEELQDRKNNSFQGIGESLRILTSLLQNYNESGKYNYLFNEAKNANFDCACGYEPNECEDTCLEQMDVLDCIYLAMELQYLDVVETLVEEWKSGVVDWTDAERKKLIQFYDYLGKNNENAIQYNALLNTAIASGKCFDIVSAYNNIINCYMKEKQYELGYSYLKEMIATVDFKEILQIRLFASVLEESFEIICALDTPLFDLWKWAKKYLLNMEKQKMFGNLYKKAIAAAKRCGDPIATELENEYITWKNTMGITRC